MKNLRAKLRAIWNTWNSEAYMVVTVKDGYTTYNYNLTSTDVIKKAEFISRYTQGTESVINQVNSILENDQH